MPIKDSKKKIRDSIAGLIEAITLEQRQFISVEACNHLYEFLTSRHRKNILLFSSLPDEVDTSFFLSKAMAFKIYLPKVNVATKELTIHPIENFIKDTQVGSYNILEPNTPAVTSVENLFDCIVVPARAVDFEGNRLGRGLGYYDRLLAQIKSKRVLKVCFAYHFQLLGEVPVESFDMPIDFFVSEKGAFHLYRKV